MNFPAFAIWLLSLGHAHGESLFRPSLRDFVHTAWTQHDGVPLASIGSITQTADGYLWITTKEAGLLRFDGIRFVPISSPCGFGTREGKIRSDGAGGLWIACDKGLYHRYASGKTEMLHPTPDRPKAFCFVDKSRRFWAWEDSITYIRPDGSQSPKLANTTRPMGNFYCQATEDSEGNVWFSAENGLIRIQNDRAERLASGKFYALAPAPSGGVYALQEKALVHVSRGAVSTIATFGDHLTPSHGTALAVSKAGIWFATRNHGVALIRGGTIELLSTREGLTRGAAEFVFVDKEDSVWVATSLGLNRFREPMANVLSGDNLIPPGRPLFVFRDRGNGLWIGTERKTVRMDLNSGKTTTIEGEFYCIGEDEKGQIWLSNRKQIGVLKEGQFVSAAKADGSHLAEVYSLRQDHNGQLWLLSAKEGLYKIVEDRPQLEFSQLGSYSLLLSRLHGIWLENKKGSVLQIRNGSATQWELDSSMAGKRILTIAELDGSIWVGSYGGVSRWRDGKWVSWTSQHGLPGQGGVFEITTDQQGRLWFMSEGGILILNAHQFDQPPNPQTRLEYLRVGGLDGIVPHVGGIVCSPRLARSLDGALFFATVDSIAVVDPRRIEANSFRPPIVLERVLANRKEVPDRAQNRFTEPDDLQFEYTSLSLRNPENVRFRYRLENYDKEWIDAGTQRRATYSALSPGSYQFHVIGSGSEGVWNQEGATYSFQIVAPFYKTPWFLAAVLIAIASLTWTIHRYRLQLAADRIQLRLETQNAERLRIAQNIHDTFLQGVQSSAWLVDSAIGKIQEQPAHSRKLLERALHMVSQSAEEARAMLSTLRSDATLDEPLLDRLSGLAAGESSLHPRPPAVTIESAGQAIALRRCFSDEAYFVGSEAIKNSFRHAKARNVRIHLNFTPSVFQLIVEDDGIGIAPDVLAHGREGHFGLRGMRERAERHSGQLKIECPEGRGTRITFSTSSQRAYQQ